MFENFQLLCVESIRALLFITLLQIYELKSPHFVNWGTHALLVTISDGELHIWISTLCFHI